MTNAFWITKFVMKCIDEGFDDTLMMIISTDSPFIPRISELQRLYISQLTLEHFIEENSSDLPIHLHSVVEVIAGDCNLDHAELEPLRKLQSDLRRYIVIRWSLTALPEELIFHITHYIYRLNQLVKK
jgi:hypothetical protein